MINFECPIGLAQESELVVLKRVLRCKQELRKTAYYLVTYYEYNTTKSKEQRAKSEERRAYIELNVAIESEYEQMNI